LVEWLEFAYAVDTLIFCAKANRNAQIHMIQDGQKKEEVKNIKKNFLIRAQSFYSQTQLDRRVVEEV